MRCSIMFPSSQMQRHSELLSHKTDVCELDSLSSHTPVQEMGFSFQSVEFSAEQILIPAARAYRLGEYAPGWKALLRGGKAREPFSAWDLSYFN